MKIKLFGKQINNTPYIVLFDEETSLFDIYECDKQEFYSPKSVAERNDSFKEFITNYVYPYPVCRLDTMKNIIKRNIDRGAGLSKIRSAVYSTFPKETITFLYDNNLNTIVREPSARLYKENGNTNLRAFDFVEVDFPTVNDIDMSENDRKLLIDRLKYEAEINKNKLIQCAILKIKEELIKRKYDERLIHFLKVDNIIMTCIGHLVLTFSFKNIDTSII
jgi:hypothetical protein